VADEHTVYEQRRTINVDGSEIITGTGAHACSCGNGGDHTRLIETIDLRGQRD
jgi:hypothetical protein